MIHQFGRHSLFARLHGETRKSMATTLFNEQAKETRQDSGSAMHRETNRSALAYYESIAPSLRARPFCTQSSETKIRILDVTSTPNRSTPYVFCNSDDFDHHISTAPAPHTRIISISSQNSIFPLGITISSTKKLMDKYDIGSAFLNLALSFGGKPRRSEAGHGGMTVTHREDGSYDMQYLFTYADRKTPTSLSWTTRQVGVFHRYDPSGHNNLWIFLHAQPESKAQQNIEALFAQPDSDTIDLQKEWHTLHLLVLSTYLGNWRWFIRSLGDDVEHVVDVVLTLDFSTAEDSTAGLSQLLKLQLFGDRLLALSSWLGVALTTVRKLEEMNALIRAGEASSDTSSRQMVDELAYFRTQLEGNLKSLEVLEELERKVQVILNLFAATLSLKSQTATVGINDKMLKLTTVSVEDSATVRVVTIVTLIYLPASFVSTFLGMNLFTYSESDGSGFGVSRQFWIFLVLAVPLTLLTLGSWYVLTRTRKRQKEQKEQKEQKREEWGDEEKAG